MFMVRRFGRDDVEDQVCVYPAWGERYMDADDFGIWFCMSRPFVVLDGGVGRRRGKLLQSM